MTALVGATIRSKYMNVSTQAQADALWTGAEPNGFGLPAQSGKTFYGTMGSYPTTIGLMEQTFINDDIGMCPVINPTYPFTPNPDGTHPELPQIKAFLNMLINAGATIPCVMVGNEVNSGRTYSASAYLSVVQAIQGVRSVAPLGISFSGYKQDTQASYWNKNLHDMMQVDFYLGAYSSGRTLDTAIGLANTAGCPIGLGEMGNNNLAVVGTTLPTGFVAYMSYLTDTFQGRASANQPIGQIQWWNGAGPSSFGAPGNSVIASPTDPRLPYIRTLFAAVQSSIPTTSGQYDVGSNSTNAAGTTLVVSVGSGSIGHPQGTSAGDLVYVLINSTVASQTIVSVTDSKGNSYAVANSYSAGATQNQWLYASKTTAALVAGTDTITITYGTSCNNKSAIVRGSTGVVSATPDKAVVISGTGTAPSSGSSGTLSHSNELVIGSIADGSAVGQPTSPSFGTAETIVQSSFLTIFDESVNSSAAVTASAMLPGSGGSWSAMVTTFQQVGPTVTTGALPGGVVGTAYLGSETASGGSRPYTWALTTGSLPAGLTLNSDGSITGTPTTAGTSTFTVTVTASGGVTAVSGSQAITISSGALTITTGALAGGSINAAYSASETASGGATPYTWALASGTLPPGVSLSSAGAFSGTPTATGTYSFTVTVTDNVGTVVTSGTQSITIGAAGSVSCTAIDAVVVDVSNALQSGHDQAVIAHGSSTAPSVTTATLAQAEEEAFCFITDTHTGGAPTYAAPWASNVLGSSAAGGNSHITVAYQAVNATTALTGSATIVSAPWTAAVVTEPIAPPFSSFTLSDGIVGEPYSQTIEASGGVGTLSYARTGSGIPGVSFSGNVYSGTPTTAGTFNFTITITDSESVVFDLPVSVTIHPANGPSAATAQPMGTSLISQADSDFESGVGSWAAGTNASSVTTSTNEALTGSHSLRWTATSDGATSVTSGMYTGVVGGKPYIASAYLLSLSNLAPNLVLTVNWYTSASAFISSTSTPAIPMLAPGMFQGTPGAFVAPSNASKFTITLEVDNANAGDTNYADLVFFAPGNTQVLIDFVNPAFGADSNAGNNFIDVSPWVRMDTGINTTSGRQDAISEISTGQASVPIENDGGWFTENNENSIAVVMGGKVTLQARCQVNMADQNGAWYTRYDGQVSNISYSIDPTGNTNIATFYVSDILAQLSRQDPLQCWTKEQVLANGPALHWSLDDSPNPSSEVYTLASESSGNSGPPLKLVRSALTDTATITWNNTTGGVETLADAFAPNEPDGSGFWPAGSRVPSGAIRGLASGAVGPFTTPISNVYFTPKLSTTGTAKNSFTTNTGYHLQAQLPAMLNPASTPGGDFTVEAWFALDPAVAANVTQNLGPYTVFSLGSSRRGQPVLVAGVFQPATGNIPEVGMAVYNGGPPAFPINNFPNLAVGASTTSYQRFDSPDLVQIPHHLVVTVTGDPSAPLATVYVDGVPFGIITLPAGTTFDTITVGGAYGTAGCFFGAISMVSIYDYALPFSTITLDCQLGQYGMWEAPTDDCIAQLATFADVPAFWNNVPALHNGLSLTDYYSISGSNAYTAMTVYEQTEAGLLFVNPAGQLSFQTRDARLGYGAPKLTLPPDSYSENLGLQVIDTYQVNENAVASNALPGGASFVNQGSQTAYGTYAKNPVGSPIQLAHISWSRGYGVAGLQEYNFWPDPNMEDAAAWSANSRSDPWFTLGGITIDLLTVDPTWGINISDLYALQIGDVIALGGTLPASFPNEPHANEFFIEGISEVNSQTTRTITFYISPALTQRAWIPGDTTYGVLGTTTRLGVSAADVSTPQADGKDVSHDGGPPYWAPAFSTTMNSPAGNQGFVGMNDMRGLTWPLQQMLQPPMAAMGISSQTQSVASGGQDQPQLFWDTLYCDSANGMGILPGYPNWYVCLQAGFYEIDAGAVFAAAASGGGSGMLGWIVVAENAAQLTVAGLGDPTTVDQYVCPIGESVRQNTTGAQAAPAPTTRLYLGLGDMVTMAVEQATGSAVNTGTAFGGSHLSIRFVGLGTVDDRAQINSSINNGGTVTTPSPITHGTNTYYCSQTFSHYGYSAGTRAWQLRNKGGNCYVGSPQGNSTSSWTRYGSQYTLIRFPFTQMQSDLAGKTILAVSLKGTNIYTGMTTGAMLLGGYYYTNNEGATWQPNAQNPGPQKDLWSQFFRKGQTVTFALPASQFQQYFLSDGAHGIMIGDNATQSQGNYGYWNGGANSWKLTVTY